MIEPGVAKGLAVEMPSLLSALKPDARGRAPLRITHDGREVLRADVRFHPRAASEIFFGNNPGGGTGAGRTRPRPVALARRARRSAAHSPGRLRWPQRCSPPSRCRPPLLVCAAFGAAGLAALSPGWRHAVRAAAVLLTCVALLVTLATTLHYQAERVWGVPEDLKQLHQMLRQAVDSALGFARS